MFALLNRPALPMHCHAPLCPPPETRIRGKPSDPNTLPSETLASWHFYILTQYNIYIYVCVGCVSWESCDKHPYTDPTLDTWQCSYYCEYVSTLCLIVNVSLANADLGMWQQYDPPKHPPNQDWPTPTQPYGWPTPTNLFVSKTGSSTSCTILICQVVPCKLCLDKDMWRVYW